MLASEILKQQRTNFKLGLTLSYEWRRKQLLILQTMIIDNQNLFINALNEDLAKPEVEAFISEIGVLLDEVKHTLKHLKKWMAPKKVSTPLLFWPSKTELRTSPHGCVLIFAPFNYPVQLALSPMIGALAAGNTVLLKPSELTKSVETLMTKLIPKYFSIENVGVIAGGAEVSEELLENRFDFIFFTGSTQVGRIVMQKASKFLTPVCLELGGKSPALIDETANVSVAARRIVWGKFFNAGQTCIAPDFVFVHDSLYSEFMKAVAVEVKKMYMQDMAHIVNLKHFERLKKILEESEILLGGVTDQARLYIEPTVLKVKNFQHPSMIDEIFGPLLPVMTFADFDDAVEILKEMERPLSFYFFSENRRRQERIITELSFGGGCINDSLIHFTNPNIPFGGTGNSGMGGYHGKFSYDTFSHQKGVVRSTTKFDPAVRYPPYKPNFLKFLKWWSSR